MAAADKKTAPAARTPGRQHGGGPCAASTSMTDKAAVKLWEALIDEDRELARELFFDALLRDAKAEYDAKQGNHDEEEEDDGRRLARVFQPSHPPAPSGSVMPLVVPVAVEQGVVLGLPSPVVPLAVRQNVVVLGLPAPRPLARKHDRAPPQRPAGQRRPLQGMKKPRLVMPPAGSLR